MAARRSVAPGANDRLAATPCPRSQPTIYGVWGSPQRAYWTVTRPKMNSVILNVKNTFGGRISIALKHLKRFFLYSLKCRPLESAAPFAPPPPIATVRDCRQHYCCCRRCCCCYKKLSYCWETVRRESMPRIAEMDVEMTT